MQTGGSLVTRKVAVHRQTCGSLPRGQGTPCGTLEWPQHPQLVPCALHHPQPSLPALPRTHRQTRRVIKPHDKLDNYLDFYRRGADPAASNSASRSSRCSRLIHTRPFTSRRRSCGRSLRVARVKDAIVRHLCHLCITVASGAPGDAYAAAPRSGSGPQHSGKHARRSPDTRPTSSGTRGWRRRVGSWRLAITQVQTECLFRFEKRQNYLRMAISQRRACLRHQ